MTNTTDPFDFVFAVPGAGNIIDAVFPPTDKGLYSGETLEEIRQRYPLAERIAFSEWTAARVRQQEAPIRWYPVSREKYHEMLEVLPPAAWTAGGFLVGEPDDHHAGNGRPRFAAYVARFGRFFAASRPLTIQEYRELDEARAPLDIIEDAGR